MIYFVQLDSCFTANTKMFPEKLNMDSILCIILFILHQIHKVQATGFMQEKTVVKCSRFKQLVAFFGHCSSRKMQKYQAHITESEV